MKIDGAKIIGEGVWLPKNELEDWCRHYRKFAYAYAEDENWIAAHYTGKADVLADILKIWNNQDI